VNAVDKIHGNAITVGYESKAVLSDIWIQNQFKHHCQHAVKYSMAVIDALTGLT